jgi:tripartite-type tricarboxylate transporter receptor subunit TctC
MKTAFQRFAAGSLALFAALGLLLAPAQAQQYPDRPVKIIIPYTPGGGSDAAARLVAGHFSKAFGQSFIVEAKPGGNTVIGTVAVARAPADGYTLLMTGGTTMSLLPLVTEKLPFDAFTDFVPLSMLSRFPFAVVASGKLGANSLREALDMARARPGELAYASNATGGTAHVGMELLIRSAQVRMTHIPYKGFAPALPDLVSGRTQLMLADLAPIDALAKAGSLKILAVTTPERSPFYPGVPTVAEQGFPGYDLTIWFAMYAPAGTPAPIVARLGDEMRKYLSSAEGKAALAAIGHEAWPTSGDAVRQYIVNERKSFQPTVQAAGIKATD